MRATSAQTNLFKRLTTHKKKKIKKNPKKKTEKRKRERERCWAEQPQPLFQSLLFLQTHQSPSLAPRLTSPPLLQTLCLVSQPLHGPSRELLLASRDWRRVSQLGLPLSPSRMPTSLLTQSRLLSSTVMVGPFVFMDRFPFLFLLSFFIVYHEFGVLVKFEMKLVLDNIMVKYENSLSKICTHVNLCVGI